VKCLKLVTDHNGPCEIGTLFLAPEYRKDNNGRLLSLVRFLFMAEYPKRFDPQVIAELRGVVDDGGLSPFWEGLGRHFFDLDYPNADYLSVVNKKFIADLMPRHPIYIPLLPKDAQAVIGKCHPQSQPALTILLEEGFRFNEMVDIFDAGPIVQCAMNEIRTAKESRKVKVVEIAESIDAAEPMLICSAKKEFRAAKGEVQVVAGGVKLSTRTALALDVKVADSVRIAPMRAARPAAMEGKSI